MFCSSGGPDLSAPRAPSPVDQNAERILFDVRGDEITATIQIQYQGDAEEFAWLIPVGAYPEVSESNNNVFAQWENFSNLQVSLPIQAPCDFAPAPGCGLTGCGSDMAADGQAYWDTSGENPVAVFGSGSTATYEFHVIGAGSSDDLVAWLQANDYNVSNNMIPLMDIYNPEEPVDDPPLGAIAPIPEIADLLEAMLDDPLHSSQVEPLERQSLEIMRPGPQFDGQAFLALKIRSDRTASSLQPVQLRYRGTNPNIPIRLTAVAAQPLMGIQVFIVADRAYAPANYFYNVPDPSEILFNELGQTNYFEWVARQADENEGNFFSAEFVGNVNGRILSRYYTRLSPHHMTVDPIFAPGGAFGTTVSNILDLSASPSMLECGGQVRTELLPSPCAFNYCGVGGTCVEENGRAGCYCSEGQVAHPITGPDGLPHVTCVPERNPYGVTPVAGGQGTDFDPCLTTLCGDEGRCVLRSGFPTCECDPTSFAVLDGFGRVSCAAETGDETTHGPGAGSESRSLATETTMTRQNSTALAVPIWLPMVLAFVLIWRMRMREAGAD